MSLKVMDGARTLDGANHEPDLDNRTLVVEMEATMISPILNMVDFTEVMYQILVTNVDTGATLVVKARESNKGTNFTDIPGASITFPPNTTNDAQWIDIDWKHPDRKRHVDLHARVTGANTATLSATSLRVAPRGGDMTPDESFTVA